MIHFRYVSRTLFTKFKIKPSTGFQISSTHKWNQYFLLLEDYLTWVVLDFSFFWIFYFFFLLKKKGQLQKKGGDHIFF